MLLLVTSTTKGDKLEGLTKNKTNSQTFWSFIAASGAKPGYTVQRAALYWLTRSAVTAINGLYCIKNWLVEIAREIKMPVAQIRQVINEEHISVE